ncbi:hypothetical protein CDL12_23849 [Handroanthus impetiginosus]|uniref:Uncharacterized protein n=1 Tax=Handroanthus impetiginosus TaxID=429701 RepID=A0A2G9GE99_9LAMI|nr:hypothetical protein CDL12_23849 [Handroanthus impetiginosus]
MRDSKSDQNETMEPISEGMTGSIQAKNEKNLDQDRFQPPDQSILISEDFTLSSYYISDAYFSIDITKSIGMEENTNESFNNRVQLMGSKEKLEVGKRESFEFDKKDLKSELSLVPIGSQVWEELGQENKNAYFNATNGGMQTKDQNKKGKKVKLRRPFWSKLLMCF